MAETLTIDQLESYQELINTGRAGDFYKIMLDNGYGYAGWALGVFRENTFAGLAAIGYMSGSAMMGPCGEECEALTPKGTADMKKTLHRPILIL